MDCFAATFQNDTVSALDAKGSNLYQCIGTAFKYNPDDPDRTYNTVKRKAPGYFFCIGGFAQRIRQGGKAVKTFDRLFKFLFVKNKTVKQG